MPQFDHEQQPSVQFYAEHANKPEYLGSIDMFGNGQIYDPESPATLYIRERLNILCGDEYPIPDTYVLNESGINAAATTDTIVVHADVFSGLSSQEELDALLGHELGHVVKKNTCRNRTNVGPVETIGVIRSGEIEADIFAMTLLDKRGINPLGVMRLMDKLDQTTRNKSGERSTHASVTHGDSMERRVTLEQALTIIDTKYLSPNLTPLEKSDLGKVVTLSSDAFTGLSPSARQSILSANWGQVENKSKCITLQKQLIRDLDETIPEDMLDLAAQIVLDGRSVHYVDEKTGPVTEGTFTKFIAVVNILNSHAAHLMVPRHLREFHKRHFAAQVALNAVNDETVTPQQVDDFMTELADLEIRFNPEHTLENNNLPYSSITVEKTAKIILGSKSITEGFSLPASYDKEGVLAALNSADKTLIKTFHSIPKAVDKLVYIAERYEGNYDSYSSWGTGFVARPGKIPGTISYDRREIEAESIGENVYRLETLVLNTTPKKIINGIVKRSTELNSGEVTQRAARMAVEIYVGETRSRDRIGFKPVDLVQLALLSGDTDLLRVYMDSGRWFEYTGNTLRAKDTLQENAAIALDRLHVATAAYSELMTRLPGDIILPDPLTIAFQSPTIQTALLHSAFHDIVSGGEDDDIISVRQLVVGNMVPVIAPNQLLKTNKMLEEMNTLWQQTAENILMLPDIMHDEDALLTIVALGMSASDLELRLTLPKAAFQQIARLRSFGDGLRLFDDFPTNTSLHFDILQILIEEKAETTEDFEVLNAIAKKIYDSTLANNLKAAGVASILDSVLIPEYSSLKDKERVVGIKVDRVHGLENSKLLAGMLSSGEDDSLLKHYMAERWWLDKRTGSRGDNYTELILKYFVAEDYIHFRGVTAKRPRLIHWLKHEYPQPGIYEPFSDDLRKIYLATEPARFIAVRKLLLAPKNGILMEDEGRKDLVDALMESWLTIDDDTERTVTGDLLLDLITDNDVADTYQHIGPMLQDMILKVPRSPSDLHDITLKVADGVMQGLASHGRLKNPTDEDRRFIHHKVHTLFTGLVTAEKPSDDYSLQLKNDLLKLLGVLENENAGNKLSTIGFAALAGKKSGALGVKMLQLAGQYFDLTPDDIQAFEGIYDDMVGQTRLQAYNTLKREAATDMATAELLKNIKTFGPRIGGGSLFTVYKVFMQDGQEVAVGLKNPNAGYRVGKLAEFTSNGLESTVQKHPESTTLKLLSSLLEDAATWVHDELEDVDATHKDAVFASENNTVTAASHAFGKGTAKYELVTPSVLPNNSSWIRAEAFVDGKNLTGLTIVDDAATSIPDGQISRDDFKQVASLLTRNYVHQIMTGSYVHSDIHPGNFRVTSDNAAVAIFDRHNLITMKPELRKTVIAAFESILADDLPQAMLAIASYANEGKVLSDELVSSLDGIAARAAADPSKMIADGIVAFKKAGIKVPLDLSLILRNFMSISQLSAKAGFSNLADSFLHTASADDLKNFGL